MADDGVIDIRNVTKTYATRDGQCITAVRNLHARIEPGQFVFLLGPSGCGKSTVLNMLAGFEKPTDGEILLSGTPIGGPDSRRTVVFQDVQGSLFPWMTVQENVEFGLKMAGTQRRTRQARANALLSLVGLQAFSSRMPFELSGGMRQRVQIARGLAIDPQILLMDEPFGALDAQTRALLQSELERIWQETKKTIIFVTHDILECVRLADRIIVFSRGPNARVLRDICVPNARPRNPMSGAFSDLTEEIDLLLHTPGTSARLERALNNS